MRLPNDHPFAPIRSAGYDVGVKIGLCIPVHEQTKALFTLSVLAMQAHTSSVRPDIQFSGHMRHGSSLIEEARETLAQLALRAGAEWILWLDSDHTFPKEALVRLLAHNKPFVGCNYRRRKVEVVESSARNWVNGSVQSIDFKRAGLERVDFIGFGLVLTKASIFDEIPKPWFQTGVYGEDGDFSQKATAVGFPPFVDHSLSMEVGHIAETVLKFPQLGADPRDRGVRPSRD